MIPLVSYMTPGKGKIEEGFLLLNGKGEQRTQVQVIGLDIERKNMNSCHACPTTTHL